MITFTKLDLVYYIRSLQQIYLYLLYVAVEKQTNKLEKPEELMRETCMSSYYSAKIFK